MVFGAVFGHMDCDFAEFIVNIIRIALCIGYSTPCGRPISSATLFRQLYRPIELTERNSTKTCHAFGSECDLRMHVQNLGYPLY